jgi:hypothetical protein
MKRFKLRTALMIGTIALVPFIADAQQGYGADPNRQNAQQASSPAPINNMGGLGSVSVPTSTAPSAQSLSMNGSGPAQKSGTVNKSDLGKWGGNNVPLDGGYWFLLIAGGGLLIWEFFVKRKKEKKHA